MHANRNFDPLVAFPPPGGLGLSLVLFAFGFLQAFGEVGNYSLYVDENRSLWAMGDNDNGQLGDGNLTDRNQTYKISTGGGVVDFAHGMDHTLYVQDDGSLWVIGDNAYGQLGDGSTTDRNSSYRIVDANVTAVAAGMHHSVFLKRDGSLWTMGRNDYGQLGNGNGAQQTTPQHIVVAGVLSISAGGHHTCFVKADGSLWTSGLNANGQLGNGFTNNLITPALIEYSGVSAVAAGGSHTLYLKRDGSLWAMGYNAYGQLGDDNNTDQSTSLKVVEANVTAIAAGSNHSFYLDANGSLWGAGYNAHGQLGDGTTSDRNVSFVEIVEANVTGVSAGSGHSLYLDANGSLWAMGLNSDGQLGLGDDANRTSPVEVVASGAYRLPGHGVLEGHGSSFSLYADVNGSLWGMGQNDNGEMGLPGLADRNVSSQVEASAVRSFSEGADYSLFVKTDGSLWGMGYNAHGQLGDGTVLDRNASVQIRASGVSQVSASGSNRFSLFLEDNGSLYGMGLNHKGELGLGDTVQRLTPTHVIDSVVSFAAGYDHTLFVKGDGSLWSMGSNAYGQLGDGSTTDRSLPVKIVDANVTAVAAGDGHSLFLKRDGSVWTMGRNDYGQLGDGNLTSRATPASVYSFGILAVAAGAHSSFFIKSGGSLWSMGQNDSGQLGFWDTTGRVYPTKAVSASVTAVSARQSHTLILKTDSLWATGLNADGQLGLGDLIFRSGFYVVESSGVGTISGVFTQGGSPPAFTSYEAAATVSVSKAENDGTSVVATIAAYDPEEHPISYSISGGADGDLFEVNATGNMEVSLDSGEEVNASVGLLQFKVYPDYEHPDDADLDNIYEVIVRASDGNKTTDQVFTVTVNDSNTSAMTDSNEGAMTDSNESSLTFTFTNAGVSGRSGPTQVDANYTGTALQGAVTVNTQGIQEWTVPYKALYRIEVLGARGGSIQGFFSGGRGARSVGVFDLNVSTQLKILVGQEGVNASAAGAGGGGGSFVTYADNVALLVAGGGGGAGTDQTGGDASPEEQPGPWNIHGTSQLKGGGNVNGGGGLDNGAGDGIYGGRAFASSGLGGDSSIGGGFGGGGAAVSDYGGGGGGYSGGNGGVTHTSNFAGQGGGSYQGDAKGFLAAGYSDGNGSVLITLVKSLNFIPRDIFHGTLYVEENATLGTIVGDFNGTDDDVNATLAFSLVDGNGSTHNSFFTIDANGTLSTAAALDYETDSNMSVRLRVTDNHNAISEAPFVINVTDVDDESPVITLNGAASVTFEANATFPDPAAVAADNNDSDVTVYGAGNLLANVPGTYVLTYDLNDTSGNAATQVKRTVTVVDTTPPVITLNGDANRTYEASPKYIDDNATWVDFVDGNGTVFPTGEVNASKLGEYDLTYDLNDTSGNAATQVTRTVTIVDTTLPVITILEDANASHEAGKVYLDPGAVWSDNLDGNGTIKINSIQGGVNEGRQDVYYITYSHTDSSGNVADLKTRKITVADKTSPVITLNGYANLTYEAGPEYVDANATWIDILDGNGTVFPTGEVNASKLGTYVLNYARTDATGNMATEVIRTVQVVDTTAPVLTFEGNSSIRHRVFQPYVDLGVHATDSFDGKLAVFVDASDLNIADPGDYNVTFSATDNASNKAVPFVRRVEVSNEAPIGIEQRIIQLGEGFGSDSSVAVLSPYDINESNNSYSLVAGTGSTDNAVFTLENNGSLRPKSPLDFESNSSYSIRIRWGDEYGTGNVVEEVLTIKDSPTGIAQKVVRIEEGFTSGELAYVFSTLDPDDLNSTRPYAYSLVEGTGSSDNVSFELEANGSLYSKGVLDFESKSSYSIRVRSVDEFGADVEQPLTLELADAFLPNLDTEAATVLGPTSATLYGKIVDAGHTLGILERGFVVSRKTDPVLGEQDVLKISVAIDSETSFSSTVSELSASKRYYFRAFATNKEGTGYGAQESFDLSASNDTQIWSNDTESDSVNSVNAPNWWASPWFGNFAVTEGTDWIYHEHYAWLFIFPQEGGGLWYWQKNLGWLWTASELYPYVYRQGFGWHYFLGASDGSVFLFSYPDEIWIDVARETDR
jgi:alpha-tubulin suppressor-like RCC1 family protein